MPISSSTLDTLPLELQQQILSHLPLPFLLTFARTSKRNYHLSTSSITELNLAVFSKRVHGILAFLNTSSTFLEDPSLHQIAIPTEPKPKKKRVAHSSTSSQTPELTTAPLGKAQDARHTAIHSQNALLASLLSTPTLHALKSLHINTTAIFSSELTSVLATCFPHLRHLSLNCSHPYIHEPCLPSKYWTTTPWISDEGTVAWNSLAGIGEKNEIRLKVKGLETLEVRRAGMTGRQCLEMVRRNRSLRVLRLDMVTGIDMDFVEALAKSEEGEGRSGLRVLGVDRCANLLLKAEQDFDWIEKMVSCGLRELSLEGCEGVDESMVGTLSKERRWKDKGLRLVMPDDGAAETKSCDGDIGTQLTEGKRSTNVLEVDPDYA